MPTPVHRMVEEDSMAETEGVPEADDMATTLTPVLTANKKDMLGLWLPHEEGLEVLMDQLTKRGVPEEEATAAYNTHTLLQWRSTCY